MRKQSHRSAVRYQRLCFHYTDSHYLFFLNPKFQASSYLLWLHSLVCVKPGQKPGRPVFSCRGSFIASHCFFNYAGWFESNLVVHYLMSLVMRKPVIRVYHFSPYTILWKLPFCISSCSETPPAKYDLVILLHQKILKSATKILKIG